MALQGSLRWWEAGPGHEAADDTRGVKANARLTAAVAVVLTALLVAEGLNLLVGVRQHLRWHVFVGAALVPPVAVKLGSVGWRFARYYRRDPPWVRKGPPPVVLRALGPLLVVLTVVLLGTGLMLVLAPSVAHATVLRLHKVSFVGWGGCFAVHFLGHLRETAWLARRDVARRSRGGVAGAGTRLAAVAASVVAGVVVGLLVLGPAADYRPALGGFGRHHDGSPFTDHGRRSGTPAPPPGGR